MLKAVREQLSQHERPATFDDHTPLEVCAHGSGEHDAFHVTADAHEFIRA